MQKAGRNDPCPCGSGKKFKKCCESKAPKLKFQAQVLSTASTDVVQQQTHKISRSLFQRVSQPQAPKETTSEQESEIPSV